MLRAGVTACEVEGFGMKLSTASLWRMPESIPTALMDTGIRQYDEVEGQVQNHPERHSGEGRSPSITFV